MDKSQEGESFDIITEEKEASVPTVQDRDTSALSDVEEATAAPPSAPAAKSLTPAKRSHKRKRTVDQTPKEGGDDEQAVAEYAPRPRRPPQDPYRFTKDSNGNVLKNCGGNVDYTTPGTAIQDLQGVGNQPSRSIDPSKTYNTPSGTRSRELLDFMTVHDRFQFTKRTILSKGPAWLCLQGAKGHLGEVVVNAWVLDHCGKCHIARWTGMTKIMDFVVKSVLGQDDFIVYQVPETWLEKGRLTST